MSDGTPKAYDDAICLFISDVSGMPYLYLPYLHTVDRSVCLDEELFTSESAATIRLPNTCSVCGDAFPTGAAFCISCGVRR